MACSEENSGWRRQGKGVPFRAHACDRPVYPNGGRPTSYNLTVPPFRAHACGRPVYSNRGRPTSTSLTAPPQQLSCLTSSLYGQHVIGSDPAWMYRSDTIEIFLSAMPLGY